uniref:Structural maintenance of chromosomes protein 5 n=1 Tax=Gasterosteus aculeatus aculeatus TaxID=481459 RepID=A0AAQ4QR56_GASAC
MIPRRTSVSPALSGRTDAGASPRTANARLLVTMATFSKKRRQSQVKSGSQSTKSLADMFLRGPTGVGEEGRFVEGSILRLTMKNFLTYDYSVLFPGPNLNMIVGANGTGKSSIVCAICLGLAGKTAILGRGDKVGLYVKRGCNKGFIEIVLYKTGGNVVINREIHVENNQSLWMLNDRHCNQKSVEEEVKALRIQVGNLCQFLPQEKVGEFAKMSKIELLEATEKSVGPPEMYEYHCELKNFRNRERELEVIEEPYLRVLYTTDERYTLKRSYYSNKISTSNSAVHASQYLIITVDAEEKRLLEQQMKGCESKLRDIDERIKALQAEAATLDRRDNELLAEKKHLCEVKGKKRQLEQKISTKQDSLRQMEQSVINLQTIEEETKAKIAVVNAEKVSIITVFLLRSKLTMEKVYLALDSVGLMGEKNKLENDCRHGASELKITEVSQKCSRLEQRKVQLTEQCKGLLKRAMSICKMRPDESLPEDLRNAFSKLPDTLDEIDAMLNEERSRAECFTGLNENVVDEYNKREQEIKHLEKELEDESSALNTYRQNISEAKERWLNPLKQLVEQINDKFSDFFRSMQCAGEVDLHSENEEEYDKYGIRIRVKFHSSTQLHELTAYHQSGGERSVSTMLYLMALQELNRCPFRVVDEINQGMDPVNERRVFDIVVRTACKETTSQYFFITPKLLQNLQYADEMTVLCVHNGSQMLPPNQWDEREFIKRCRQRKAVA